jgi:hypothetical protein
MKECSVQSTSTKELSQRLNTAYISYKNKFAMLKGALKLLGGGWWR